MIQQSLITLDYIKKEEFNGSFSGMRYHLKKIDDVIEVAIWPEPNNFVKTNKELIQTKKFEFSQLGKEKAVDWLNLQYETQIELWNSVARKRVLHS